jgi:aspartyl-tRNA(Asn)/glutamyl-tRNA(Gln) amidotransferase subunit A
MTELAFSGLGLNPMTATPPNVNDPALVPGGSSSGAAASVAFGLVPAAIGSDTGGSVRLPAAWNNLTGLKTSHGWLPLDGVVPLIPSFDTVGPLTRSAEDAGRLAALMAGEAEPDLTPRPLEGAKLLICRTLVLDDLRPEPAAAFERAVLDLSRAGARIDESGMPEVAEAAGLTGALFAPEAWAIWRTAIEAAPDKMFAPVRDRFRGGATVLAADHIAAWQRLKELRRTFWQGLAEYDAVLMPTSAILPPDAARLLADPAFFTAENLLALRNTRVANLLGACALTLPTATPACGISLMAAPGRDLALVRLGISAEPVVAG